MTQTLPFFATAMLETPMAFAGERDDLGRTTREFRLRMLEDFATKHRFKDVAAAVAIAEKPLDVDRIAIYVMGDDPLPIEWKTNGSVTISEICLMIRSLGTAMAIASLNVPEDDHMCMDPVFLEDGSMLTTDLSNPSLLTRETIARYGLEGDLSYLASQEVEGWQDAVLWGRSDSAYAENVIFGDRTMSIEIHPH
jgi:hypothetical protein